MSLDTVRLGATPLHITRVGLGARVANLPSDDWRAECDDFLEPKLSTNLALLAGLTPIAERLNITLPELAIAWTLAWPAVTGAIVGARTPEQVDEWVGAGDVHLDADTLDEISGLLAETRAGDGPYRPATVGA